MNKKQIAVIILIVVLAASTAFLWFQNAALRNQLGVAQAAANKEALNDQIVAFTQQFIEKVLMAKQAVSFDDRLALETMVRNLNEPDILAQWENFVNSSSSADAQNQVKILLDLLVTKIKSS
jgi:hypothetical protein